MTQRARRREAGYWLELNLILIEMRRVNLELSQPHESFFGQDGQSEDLAALLEVTSDFPS